jgi:hypothetical protein
MKILFYSNKCEYSQKIMSYMEKNKILLNFELINIDTLKEIPKEIDIVPAIIDEELREPLKGKNAFEYLINKKYFNNPTNNVEYVKYIPPNPKVVEDDKALSNNINQFEMNNNLKNNNISEFENVFKNIDNISLQSIETRPKTSVVNKQAILLKLARK